MSTSSATEQKKKMQECNRCKAAGFPNQPIGFEKIGEDPTTGKAKWKLVDENGAEHVHKGNQQQRSGGSGNDESRFKLAALEVAESPEKVQALVVAGFKPYGKTAEQSQAYFSGGKAGLLMAKWELRQ